MFNLGIPDLINETASIIPGVGSGSSEDESEDDQLATASEFSLSFDAEGGQQTFYFSLLPAVDDGNETTDIPEIKPGILKKTNMQVKRFQIPGGSSVFQMVGVRETILQCVGLLIGNEGLNSSRDALAVDAYDPNAVLNAYKSALEFDNEVVQRGSKCKLNITSVKGEDDATQEISIKHDCFIQNYRYFANRSDRVWFSLDLIVLDYTPGGTKFSSNVQEQQEADVDVSEDLQETVREGGLFDLQEILEDGSTIDVEKSGDESDEQQDSSGAGVDPRKTGL